MKSDTGDRTTQEAFVQTVHTLAKFQSPRSNSGTMEDGTV